MLALDGRPSRATPPPISVEVVVRLARCAGKPVRGASWVGDHIEAANRVLAPVGVRIAARIVPFSPPLCRLLSIGERDAMAAWAPPGELTVIVIEEVRDLRLRSYKLMGVHWRYRGADARYAGRRWVFLTARARPPVLAHELCHRFGLRHDPAGGNLMTPGPSDPVWRRPGPRPQPFAPLLTEEQGRRVRRFVKRLGRGGS